MKGDFEDESIWGLYCNDKGVLLSEIGLFGLKVKACE